MKSEIYFFVVFLSAFSFAAGYTYQTKPSTHEDHPGKCWHKISGKAYAPGESFDDRTLCERLVCESDFSFIVAACDRIYPDSQCVDTKLDLAKDFPACCVRRIVCA